MPIRYERRITRDMLRAEPRTLFVFGDNFCRSGLGGQAKEMRGEPNAVGIPTKRFPRRDPEAYLTDDDLKRFKSEAAGPFRRLRHALEGGGTVVMPADGIGTGLADLERRAPRVWGCLQRAFDKLKAIEPSALPCHAGEVER